MSGSGLWERRKCPFAKLLGFLVRCPCASAAPLRIAAVVGGHVDVLKEPGGFDDLLIHRRWIEGSFQPLCRIAIVVQCRAYVDELREVDRRRGKVKEPQLCDGVPCGEFPVEGECNAVAVAV